MKRILSILAIVLILAFSFATPISAFAYTETDLIHNYSITVDINEDGTATMKYHIDWEVLDDEELGPLEWVEIGLPNNHVEEIYAESDNITDIYPSGSYAIIYFDKKYYKDEVISFDFTVKQDYLYEMNQLTDGETVYWFVPGWFDSINVENLTVKWNQDKAISWDSGALVQDEYLTWETELPMGETFAVSVTYPNDAFMFDESKYQASGNDYDYDYDYDYDDDSGIFGLFAVIFFGLPWVLIRAIASKNYSSGSGFTTKTTTKIKRTLVEYHPTCPGCGAPRKEGQKFCEYCGRSYVKSEETIEETAIPEESRKKFSTDGEYSYGDNPNTYVRVHVTPIVVRTPVSRSSSGGHSSGGHSSCACACASCACACACACAGGGRAGCSTKDFYNTKLKANQFKPR